MHASENRGIPLEVGDPHARAASYTIFALPFVWSLDEIASGMATRSYKVSKTDEEHRRYFTPETANSLFDRARWYELEPAAEASSPRVYKRAVLHLPTSRDIEIVIALPRIVLFESANGARSDSIAATGFLLVELHFPSEPLEGVSPTLDDLLSINELFRYWRRPYPGHERGYLAVMSDLEIPTDPNADYVSRWKELLDFPVETEPGVRRRLVASSASEENKKRLLDTAGPRGWIAYTDNRAFVWTCVQTPGGARALRGMRLSRDPKFSAEWIRLLNVDAPSASDATDFEREWVKERTYERWKHFGTLYGFNTHAGAMISEPCDEPPLWRYFHDLYLNQMLLLLYLRVSTFRYSEKLAEISTKLLSIRRLKEASVQFRKLRREFAALTNLYRFPLISSQQQGIEMYAYARRSLDIDELFEEVQTEIESTHEMFELVSTQRMAQATADLTYLVVGAGAYGMLMAFLAAEDMDKISPPREALLRQLDFVLQWWFPGWSITPAWSLILLSSPLVLLLFLKIWKRQHD